MKQPKTVKRPSTKIKITITKKLLGESPKDRNVFRSFAIASRHVPWSESAKRVSIRSDMVRLKTPPMTAPKRRNFLAFRLSSIAWLLIHHIEKVFIALGRGKFTHKKFHALNSAQGIEDFSQYPHPMKDVFVYEEFFFPRT